MQYLAEFLLKAEPQEMLVIRDALLDHKEILLEQLWAKLENPQHDQGQRFRAACALADYSPDDSRWEKVATDVAEWLCIQKTFEIAQWTDAFQGVGRWLITPLADFLDDDDRVLSERGLVAKVYNQFAARIPEAYDRLEELLVKESEPFSSLDARIAVAKQKASVGGGLLVMGYSRNVWPLMEHNPDPTLRSFLIERLKPMGVDPNVLMARLHEEQAVSVKRAILMSLGEYGLDNSSVDLRLKMLPQLLNSYRDDPDPGIHGITEWLLRSWQASNEMHAIDRQLATVNMKGKRQWHLNKQGQTMVVVPKPGEFWIGKGRKRQQVLIDRSFAIASKEVTVDQFLRFRNEYEYSEESSPTGDCPINSVSWYEAAAYCNWLSEQEGIPNDQWCYEPNADGYYLVGMTMPADSLQRTGYRLPTIAEWEYACRAGAATVYSIGVTAELLGKYGWFAENSLNTTHPAGSLKANDLGLFDMYGNTSEWCQDYIDLDFPFADNRELEEFPLRVLCGGSFKSKSLHSADRDSADLNSGSVVHGFRLARTLPPVPRASEGVEKTDK
ncbi:MAG: SUMF1/EgtB/PvdO family nonheme iron enzyme [Planctomycetaceae bacterium]